MNDLSQKFHRAWSLLNSLFIPVLVLSLADILNLSFLMRFGFIFIVFITAALKIYAMSAVSGGILEIISGQELVLRLRRMHQNAMDLAPCVVVVFILVRLVDFMVFAIFPLFRAWRPVYFGLLEALAAYVLAQWTINKKYVKPLGIPPRKFKVKLHFVMVMALAYLSQLMLVGLLNFIHTGDFYGRNILALMVNYIHVFEYIFCSLCILDDYPRIREKFSSSPEVYLINPMGPEVVQSLAWLVSRAFEGSYPPVFVVLKALTPKTYQCREFNQVIWHERYYKGDVLVCVTCFTSNSYEAYKIAKEFKKRGAKVVMGGPHVTYFPSEALMFCDTVIIGQAEGVWKDVIRDYENGALKPRYSGPATEADYAQVHEALLNSPPSVIKDFLETSRGCKFRCHFCTIPALSGGQVRTVPVNDFVQLIQKIRPHYRAIAFIDNNIYADPAYAKELFRALKPLRIKWYGMCTIDIAKDQEALELARESGCVQLVFGYEIFAGSLEKDQGGKFAMAQKYLEYTKRVKKAGINVDGRFIFGFDSDGLKSLCSLWKFCFLMMPKFTAISFLTPLPGCGVYRDMLDQNRIISLNWRSYTTQKMVIRHPRLGPGWMSFFFIWIQVFFMMTTSSGGVLLTAFCCAIVLWVKSLAF